MTSSGVFPSTSLAIFSISSRPHFSLALINWLKSLLFQFVNPCVRSFSFSSNSSSLRGSASSIFSCSSFCACAALGRSGLRGTLYPRSEEHTSELQSHSDLVCRLLLEKKKKYI